MTLYLHLGSEYLRLLMGGDGVKRLLMKRFALEK